MATETRFWPLYEIENGSYKMTYENKEKASFEDYLKMQGRFKHIFTDENKHLIEEMKANIDREYENLQKKCQCIK